jgi:AcrR family transcriptional regulator
MARARAIPNAATGLRKAPRQVRSGETFEAILAAAAHILASEGAQRFTTNRVAKRAGVSIGSLYQYFPNKQAIARALVERDLARAARLRPALLDDPGQPPGVRMRALVDWLLDSRADDPALARELRGLVEAALPAAQRREVLALRARRTRRTVASVVDPARDADQVAFVVETCLDAIVEATVAHRPQWLQSGAFRAEVARLLERYLAQPG